MVQRRKSFSPNLKRTIISRNIGKNPHSSQKTIGWDLSALPARKLLPQLRQCLILHGPHLQNVGEVVTSLGGSLAAFQPNVFRPANRFFQTRQNDIICCQYLEKY